MDYRWKNRGGNLPNVQPNFVDPQGVRATIAQQQMAGYQPNPQVNVPNPQGPSRSPVQPTSGEGYQFDSSGIDQFNAKKEKLATLKSQLATIDGKLAELKATAPDDEKAIAAKLMEIGDTSLYQGILARQQNQAAQQKSNASAIDNMLFEADKISWGLASKSDEERAVAKQVIQAQLGQAKRVAEQTNTPLPPKYRELEQKLAASDEASANYESQRKRANELWLKARKRTLKNGDIKEMEDYIAANPNSDISGQYRQLIEQYQGKTTESKASASKRKADARDLFNILSDLPKDEQARRMRNLTATERKLLEDFYPDILK